MDDFYFELSDLSNMGWGFSCIYCQLIKFICCRHLLFFSPSVV
jgi:hypothetical protein